MEITQLLNEETIILDLRAHTKDEVIDELIEALYKAGKIVNIKKFKKDIMAREKLSSTGIGHKVAIPHAKSKYVSEPAIVFGFSKTGIDFKSIDEVPVQIFFLIAAPFKGHDIHLEALSKLARLLMHDDFREGLSQIKTKNELIENIKKHQS